MHDMRKATDETIYCLIVHCKFTSVVLCVKCTASFKLFNADWVFQQSLVEVDGWTACPFKGK